METVEQPADASSSQGNDVDLATSAPSPPSDGDAIRGLNQIPPSQHHVFCIRRMTIHMKPPSETQLDYHAIDIEVMPVADDDEAERRRLPPVNLGKVFLGLTYQAMVAFMVFHFSSSIYMDILRHSKLLSFLLNFSEVTVVIGFTASLVGVLMRELVSMEMAMVAERAGSASAALGFFLMMSMFLSKLSLGIGWVCGVVSFVVFVLVFMKVRKAG
ncbi:hypothetical protein BT93_B1660 [Corymbia citriodora subsp. variegata]|nr:hypothetical protein BT93_B1660 [Corymbia citriodora subsp. variegata]